MTHRGGVAPALGAAPPHWGKKDCDHSEGGGTLEENGGIKAFRRPGRPVDRQTGRRGGGAISLRMADVGICIKRK